MPEDVDVERAGDPSLLRQSEGPGNQIALGTAQWGMPYGVANRSGQPDGIEIERILAHARGAGIRLLDTARAYREAEDAIGALTVGDPWWRIVTKLSPDAAAGPTTPGRAADRAQASVEASLQALRRERLDVLLLHRASDRQGADGAVWERLLALRDDGLIGLLGVSAVRPEEASAALDDHDVRVLQVACSLFDRRLVDAGLFERAAVRDIEIHVRSVFLQGVAHLAPTDLPAGLTRLQAPLGAVQSWEHANGVSRGTAWVQYARRLSRASLVLGCERVEQLEGNLASMWLPPLADEEVERLCALVGQLPVELIQPSCWPDHGPVVTKP